MTGLLAYVVTGAVAVVVALIASQVLRKPLVKDEVSDE